MWDATPPLFFFFCKNGAPEFVKALRQKNAPNRANWLKKKFATSEEAHPPQTPPVPKPHVAKFG